MKNNIRLGLGILTVLATPFAVDAATGSNEAHAAQDNVKNAPVVKNTNKEGEVQKTTTPAKQVESTKKTENTQKTESTKKVDTVKKEEVTKKEDVVKKEETTKKEVTSENEKKASSKKTVSGKPQAPETNSAEKKTGWTSNGTYYVNGKLANWWYDDGKDWYFFQNGKKHTGEGKDNSGKRHFTNGKYANGYQKDTYYVNGKLADWWLDDGQDWYFFKNGKKFTGEASDSAGKHLFT